MSHSITVNESPVDLQTPCTVAELQVRLEAPAPCAVEVNREVVPRRQHPDRRLEPGDVVEIVTLVGGG